MNMLESSRKRIIDEFLSLVAIDAPSFQERGVADYIRKELIDLGFTVEEDESGNVFGSDTGNIYAYKKGNLEGTPLLFSAHMDTVQPGIGKKAIVHPDGRITSDGTTVLGADDLSGVVAILEALRIARDEKIELRDIELLFTIGEEVYLKGSEVFDYKKIQAKEAYVLDLCGPIGTCAIQAPTLLAFEVAIHGKSAHAGFAPETGINAIAIAGKIIGEIKQGRLDDETTFNIGTITGGSGTNIVSDLCTFKGEIRSLNHDTTLSELKKLENFIGEKIAEYNRENQGNEGNQDNEEKATYTLTTSFGCVAYKVAKEDSVVLRHGEICQKLGVEADYITTFGGSDNNNFLLHGIQGVVLACGMEQVHTTKEYTEIDSLLKSTEIVLELMKSKR